ncbi:hypothetical protein [Ralstonia phage phiITL-1]|uniref:Uncharacterized protein n=1 Tax=Ralstonia phage phiITL-1 TaxID=1597967 RepID=A0A0U1ZAD0_9CAUD|nr:hypothetical protein HOR02_gp33 [Ralstonia phage phiITL-1]AJT60817.1 hypothetical protein [Ralstonia phage phiITL-1]
MNGKFPFFTPSEKTCANCKHHQSGYWTDECLKFSREETRWEPIQGPYTYRNRVTCEDARGSSLLCGSMHEAKGWEPSRWALIKKGWACFPKGVTAVPIGLTLGLLLAAWIA